ncbi:hypothetical protein [uncultured Methanoregula sp.]|nr:hypothetical protein [uncultured Methanoregula sp.]
MEVALIPVRTGESWARPSFSHDLLVIRIKSGEPQFTFLKGNLKKPS